MGRFAGGSRVEELRVRAEKSIHKEEEVPG